MYCSKCGSEVADDSKFCGSCGHQVLTLSSHTDSGNFDDRRIVISYIAAIFVPLFFGFCLNGIGHLIVGRYKRGIVLLVSTSALAFILAFSLVAWPIVGASYTLPWADYDWFGDVVVESLWPGILITMLSGFLMWIVQIIDLIRINRKLGII